MKKKIIFAICLFAILLSSFLSIFFSCRPENSNLPILPFDYHFFREYSELMENENHIYVLDKCKNITQIFPEGTKHYIVLEQFQDPRLYKSETGISVDSGSVIYDFDEEGHFVGQRDYNGWKWLQSYETLQTQSGVYSIKNSVIHSSVLLKISDGNKTQTRIVLWALKPVVLYAILACFWLYWGVRKLSVWGEKLEKYFDRKRHSEW